MENTILSPIRIYDDQGTEYIKTQYAVELMRQFIRHSTTLPEHVITKKIEEFNEWIKSHE